MNILIGFVGGHHANGGDGDVDAFASQFRISTDVGEFYRYIIFAAFFPNENGTSRKKDEARFQSFDKVYATPSIFFSSFLIYLQRSN